MLPLSQYQAIVESSPNLIWRAGTDAKCDYFNATWLAFTGRSMEEERGDGWAEGVHPDDFQQCLQIYLEAFNARQAFEMEYRLKRHDGRYRWINDRGTPFFDAAGVFAGYIGSCVDVTDKIEAQKLKKQLDMKRHAEMAVMREIRLAHRLQQALMTKPISTAQVEIHTIFEPQQFVSGDVFHLEWRNNGKLLRGYLVDVSGHGLATALQTAAMNVLLHETAELDMPLSEQMRWLNRRAAQYFEEAAFAAAIAFEVDLVARELRYVGAGITEFGAKAHGVNGLVPVSGIFLGITEHGDFSSGAIELKTGDAFFFITDGLSDQMKPTGIIKGNSFDESVKHLRHLATDKTKRDDATAVCIHVMDFFNS